VPKKDPEAAFVEGLPPNAADVNGFEFGDFELSDGFSGAFSGFDIASIYII
jgi:hypothetical protein